MRGWVDEFMEEMQKVEIFYNTKFLEFQHELELLKESFFEKQSKYHKKTKKMTKEEKENNFENNLPPREEIQLT